MDRLRLAKESYERIASASRGIMDERKSDEFEAWLESSVCSVVEDLSEIGHFREYVNWPLEKLSPESAAPERRLVDGVDGGLVALARCLCQVGGKPDVQSGLDRYFSRNPAAVATDERRRVISLPPLSEIEWIAGRLWMDLVAIEDFFHPCRELYLMDPGRSFEEKFDALENPQLVTLGDYLTRLMFLRIDHWESQLGAFANGCVLALSRLDRDFSSDLEAVVLARSDFERRLKSLREACLAGKDARTRDSCIVLTQVYAAYAPHPRLDWLALPIAAAIEHVGIILACLLPVALGFYLLFTLNRHSQGDEVLTEFLIQEVANDLPMLSQSKPRALPSVPLPIAPS